MAEIPIFCGDCGAHGSVARVTAGLQCRCGSTNLGLQGVDPEPKMAAQHVAAFSDEHVERYLDWARQRKYDPDTVDTLKRYEREPGVGRAHTNFIADQLYIGGGESDWRRNASIAPGLSAEAAAKLAYPQGPQTGWGKPMPSPTRGWSQYPGPIPTTVPRSAPVADSYVCPACNGSGYDLIDKTVCRECDGTGRVHPPTSQRAYETMDATTQGPPSGGARWQGRTSARVGPGGVEDIIRRTTPNYGGWSREMPGGVSDAVKIRPEREYQHTDRPYQLDEASCPSCGHRPTQLVRDRNDDAWWNCPNCGPLANIDRNPQINPYDPPQGFTPNRNMKTSRLLGRTRKTGRLMKIMATAQGANALSDAEALTLARRTLITYGDR